MQIYLFVEEKTVVGDKNNPVFVDSMLKIGPLFVDKAIGIVQEDETDEKDLKELFSEFVVGSFNG